MMPAAVTLYNAAIIASQQCSRRHRGTVFRRHWNRLEHLFALAHDAPQHKLETPVFRRILTRRLQAHRIPPWAFRNA
jgi:hypothetical protein